MAQKQFLFRSRKLPPGASRARIDITPKKAGWKWIRFVVRQLPAGETWTVKTDGEEVCLVLLAGAIRARVADEEYVIGPRRGVFDDYPHALYLPPGRRVRIDTDAGCELAECRVPSSKQMEPRVVRPEDCGYEIRGGGNATRQIVDIIRPDFPADRLLICEVFTPGGNWSSYPPHKHDVDNPRSKRISTRSTTSASAIRTGMGSSGCMVHARRDAQGRGRRRRGDPGRLSPVRDRVRVRRVLPERARWQPSIDGGHRRSPLFDPSSQLAARRSAAAACQATVRPLKEATDEHRPQKNTEEHRRTQK
jgi:hypothetical protein